MESNSNIKSSKTVCRYCHSPVKKDEEAFQCPNCSTPYHADCWEENKGCAVYGCNYKAEKSALLNTPSEDINEVFVNIEYLINNHLYHEAMMECKRILKVDKRNIEAKKLYNKAVSFINTKTKFIENADDAYNNKDYKAAEIYYTNSLKYTSEEETDFIKSRIDVIKEKVPFERKRRRINNFIVTSIVLLIIGAFTYLAYYNFVLKEDREFAEIEKGDNIADIQVTEIQLSRYERFARLYDKGRNYEKTLDKIDHFSSLLAESHYKKDWKEALKFLNKINKSRVTLTYNDLYNKIYGEAEKEYKTLLTNAKKLDAQRKYPEAQMQLDQAIEIINNFPSSKISKDLGSINSNISVLKKKRSSLMKYSSIESEINDKLRELKGMGGNSSTGAEKEIKAIIKAPINSTTFAAKDTETGAIFAVKANNYYLVPGEHVTLICIYAGSINYVTENNVETSIPLYSTVANNVQENSIAGNYEKDAIQQRIDYLRSQKSKLDSILNLKL